MHAKALAGLAILLAAVNPAAAQNAENGERVFRKCRACHQIGEGAKNMVGPQLNDIIGRPAGSVEGFNYSSANKEAGQGGLGEEQGMPRQQPMEEPAVPVRPIHHGCDREFAWREMHGFPY